MSVPFSNERTRNTNQKLGNAKEKKKKKKKIRDELIATGNLLFYIYTPTDTYICIYLHIFIHIQYISGVEI